MSSRNPALFLTLLVAVHTSIAAAQPELAERLQQHVRFLTELSPPRNFAHPQGLDKAADYICTQLQAAGWMVQAQPYTVDGHEYRNLSALRGDPDAARVVVGAHYDVHGDLPGADDNASAVAILLELARALSGFAPEHGLELLAFTLEEQPAFARGIMGSGEHAKLLKKQGVDVKLMLALEMLGYFTDAPQSQRFPLPGLDWWYPDAGNFVGLIGRFQEWGLLRGMAARMRAVGGVPVHYLASPVEFYGIADSDHRNYWAAGYPAVMVTDTAFYRNPHYHSADDTPETLDYTRMAAFVPQLAAAITELDTQ